MSATADVVSATTTLSSLCLMQMRKPEGSAVGPAARRTTTTAGRHTRVTAKSISARPVASSRNSADAAHTTSDGCSSIR
eukprot:3119799-Pleurochrysis_carterae.AAC.2